MNYTVRKPENEKILNYSPGSFERDSIKEALIKVRDNPLNKVCAIVNGREYFSEEERPIRRPDQSDLLGTYTESDVNIMKQACGAAINAQNYWSSLPWQDRASVVLRAAELISNKYRHMLNAATMLGQGKTVFQAEIDAACETIDFLRYSAWGLSKLINEQPESTTDSWNRLDYRPLEGFVYVVTPFNFTAIASNLCMTPILMGNTVVWKPASSAMLSAIWLMKIYEEAGLPPGVLNMVPCSGGSEASKMPFETPFLAGVNFTGSTDVFKNIWKTVGENIDRYKTYPRVSGETGGKDFIYAHNSADPEALITALIRGAFEYQGQKCSACSRAYIPESLWKLIKDKLIDTTENIKMGPVDDLSNFMSAVIDQKSFDKIKSYIDYTKKNQTSAKIIAGGQYDDSDGYYIRPTIIETKNPHYRTMEEEIFGPVLTIYVYKDKDYEATLFTCDRTSQYALTGAIFANDRGAINTAADMLRNSAGNFYINDKCTGAVVGQQPFGGARLSGTNDKAGHWTNLLRWTSMRTIKENLNPPKNYKYPHMTLL